MTKSEAADDGSTAAEGSNKAIEEFLSDWNLEENEEIRAFLVGCEENMRGNLLGSFNPRRSDRAAAFWTFVWFLGGKGSGKRLRSREQRRLELCVMRRS